MREGGGSQDAQKELVSPGASARVRVRDAKQPELRNSRGRLHGGFGVGGGNVKIVLKNGAELRGEVLKEREDAVVLDLGHTVLTVPRAEISILEKATASAARPPPCRARTSISSNRAVKR
jgi:hypothetical protein